MPSNLDLTPRLELKPDYYLDNFHKLLDFVHSQYTDLLTKKEIAFYEDFKRLSIEGQRLYVRLISRKGPYLRSDKLHYEEIPNIPHTCQELEQAGFCAINPTIEIELLVEMLVREELLGLLPSRTGMRGLKKPDLIDQVVQDSPPQTLRTRIQQYFWWIEPIRMMELIIYRLCFFGNLRQDFTEFVLLDLGMIRYESYTIQPEDRYFQNRELLEKTLNMIVLRDSLEEVLESNNVSTLLKLFEALPQHSNNLSLKRRHNRITNTLARQLERLREPALALQLYEQSDFPPARERRARLLEKQGDLQQALDLCQEITQHPRSEEEMEFAFSFGNRLKKKLGHTVPKPAPTVLPECEVTLPPSDERVEMQAMLHFLSEGHQVYYVENHLMTGLFGLAFWDIVFMPLEGAFFNYYQRGPKGLFTPEFRNQREEAIKTRLQVIEKDTEWSRAMLQTYDEKQGISNSFIHWPHFDKALLELALARMNRSHLVKIFDRLSYDLGANRTGFPDLVVFPKEGGYLLVEVKSPGDRLQQNQKRWMKYFQEFGVPFQVLHVQYK